MLRKNLLGGFCFGTDLSISQIGSCNARDNLGIALDKIWEDFEGIANCFVVVAACFRQAFAKNVSANARKSHLFALLRIRVVCHQGALQWRYRWSVPLQRCVEGDQGLFLKAKWFAELRFEMLTIAMGLSASATELEGRSVVAFSDNKGAESAARKSIAKWTMGFQTGAHL